MRQSWFDDLGKMITTVRRSAQHFWGSKQIQRLFRLRTESARNLIIAIGRVKIDARNYAVETRTLLAFLEEFSTLLSPAAKLKQQRSEAIRAAQALFQKKLEHGRRAPEKPAPSRAIDDPFQAGSETEVRDASLAWVFQAQASSGGKRQDRVAGIKDHGKHQETATTKPMRPKRKKKSQVSEHSQTFLDFGEGDPMENEKPGIFLSSRKGRQQDR